jgi:drug/metabolite transporter (DMT)-like permease
VKISRGVLYMATSAFGFSAMGVLVQLASKRLPLGEIVFARAVITLGISLAMVRRAGLLGFGGLSGYYIALDRLPLADATVLQNSTPLLTGVLAWWLLAEPIGWSTAIAIACGIAGVALIVRPSGGGLAPVGVIAALGGVLCSSVAYVTVRRLSRTVPPLVIVLYFPLIATPLALPWMLASFVVPGPVDLLLLVALGAATQVGQVFLTMALAIESAGRATSLNYLQVPFAMLWQLAVFDKFPTAWTLAGACLILGGTLLVARVRGAPPAGPS